MHVLEAGTPGRPAILLLHGFPEIAYSWRRIIPALAAAGFHVIAPDQRGYGRTTGWSLGYDVDLAEFGMPALVRDALALLDAMGVSSVEAVVGHDFGSPVAAWCGMMRPDVFRAVACMSAPFAGPPQWPAANEPDIHADLAALVPPRRHYQWYYGERYANAEMMQAPEGLAAFLRAY
ncbi:MAG: alpha/beta fold hydrolase, partial [Pseudomonadota bacterium]